MLQRSKTLINQLIETMEMIVHTEVKSFNRGARSVQEREREREREQNISTFNIIVLFFSGLNPRTAMAAEAIQAGHAALDELFSKA